jgi:transposase InsO family protein
MCHALVRPSDQGCQYTSLAFGRRLRGGRPGASMGSVGDCCDNAVTESFVAALECELLHRHGFRTAPRLAWPSSTTWRSSTTAALWEGPSAR